MQYGCTTHPATPAGGPRARMCVSIGSARLGSARRAVSPCQLMTKKLEMAETGVPSSVAMALSLPERTLSSSCTLNSTT